MDSQMHHSHLANNATATVGAQSPGRTNLAHSVEEELHQQNCRTFVLDGDNVRHGLKKDLGFSIEDRDENLRRVGETVKLFLEAGTIVLAAFISHLRREREMIRSLMSHGDFLEIYCEASIDVCEQRNPKGLYEEARKGEVKEFTGIRSLYEPTVKHELTVNTVQNTLEESLLQVLLVLHSRLIFKPNL